MQWLFATAFFSPLIIYNEVPLMTAVLVLKCFSCSKELLSFVGYCFDIDIFKHKL